MDGMRRLGLRRRDTHVSLTSELRDLRRLRHAQLRSKLDKEDGQGHRGFLLVTRATSPVARGDKSRGGGEWGGTVHPSSSGCYVLSTELDT
jgi:hypothetical protein